MNKETYKLHSEVELKSWANVYCTVIETELKDNGAAISMWNETRWDAEVLDTQIKDRYFLTWEQMPDVAILADMFKDRRVDVFQHIVRMLGMVYQMRLGFQHTR